MRNNPPLEVWLRLPCGAAFPLPFFVPFLCSQCFLSHVPCRWKLFEAPSRGRAHFTGPVPGGDEERTAVCNEVTYNRSGRKPNQTSPIHSQSNTEGNASAPSSRTGTPALHPALSVALLSSKLALNISSCWGQGVNSALPSRCTVQQDIHPAGCKVKYIFLEMCPVTEPDLLKLNHVPFIYPICEQFQKKLFKHNNPQI